jgi:flagellin
MALTVNSNISSINAQRNLVKSQNLLNTSLQRLSSGLRINSAKDDASGLAAASGFTSQIRGLGVAVRAANDGISLAQTAEGALDEVTNIYQRMRELAVGGGGATEIAQLRSEITRISEDTRFASGTVFTAATRTFQAGENTGDTIDYSIGTLTVISSTDATNTVTIDAAISAINTTRANLGAVQNRLESTISNLMNVSENVSAARSRVLDTDFAVETANLTKAQILQQAGVAMLAQANQVPQTALSLIK